ncbi:hypothetical protein GZH47_14580 [Paenibacillus rhizovicinus]|uniref:Uncharacterized protein n=1 Tax=Paenibacillus rhizovicinus TaxID=2704463 RepID=A0A6C0P5N1_9BACL|nr:hypothetical protein [Paenibacillus rhizovicinus]QHW31922.1 hypothetical protein GZH47_14580 [Paenibacillus rhizovicinus]
MNKRITQKLGIMGLSVSIGSAVMFTSLLSPAFASGVNEPVSAVPDVQKRINKIEEMPNLPQPYEMKNWKQTARQYDQFVFDFTKQGTFLPVGWWDKTHTNMQEDTFGLMSYVGKFSQGNDGSQEAINMMAAVLSATLVGIDKSNQNGKNYVKMLQTFYNKDNGENVILNNPNTVSGQTFWYEILPHVLFYALDSYYPDVDNMDAIMRSTADKWASAVQELGGKYGQADFNYTAYKFYRTEPFNNEQWTEPDAAAGVAMLEYMAYAKFKDAKYLQAAQLSMDFLQRQKDNPLYEVLLYFAPYMAARMNAEQAQSFDVDKMINWVFDGGSAVRDGWGTMTGKWGGYDADGLLGSLKDNGGYAFAMNTFSAFGALAPVVRYDPRYARDIGKWMLNAANQSRLFYADALPPDHQSGSDWQGDPQHVIPYEGLRKEMKGKTPYASGDPTVSGWGNTDFSLYSGSYAGFLGGLIDTTNVEGILKIDTLKTDYFHEDAYPTYLYYNPYKEAKSLDVTGIGSAPVDLFDSVSGHVLAASVTNQATITLAGDSAAVIVVVPAGKAIESSAKGLSAGGVFVAPLARPAINIRDLQAGQTVSGALPVTLEAAVPVNKKIKQVTITFADQEIYKGSEIPSPLQLDTKKFPNGFQQLQVDLEASNGQRDTAQMQLFVRNEGGTSILTADPAQMAAWTPISVMKGKGELKDGKVVVTETNDDGAYGGIASPAFKLDFSRQSFLIVDVDSASPEWTLQLHVKSEKWGLYIKPDGPETGHFVFDVMKELRRLRPDLPYLGVQDVELWLVAADKEGAQASFGGIDMFYQDEPVWKEKEWKAPQGAEAIANWIPLASMKGAAVKADDVALIREDNLLDRGGVGSPFMSVDLQRDPALDVNIAQASNEWSLMIYVKGKNEGVEVQAPTSQLGKKSYKLKDLVYEAYPQLDPKQPVDLQLWMLAQGDNKANVGIKSVKLSYGRNTHAKWLYIDIVALLVAAAMIASFMIRSRKTRGK